MTNETTTSTRRAQPAAATGLRLVGCPECGAPAEVEWADHVATTGDPVELVKLRCLERHWFLMPAEGLQTL
ncbi:MAG: hypothetical protein M3171_09815 [Actinomycetota bacterium]|nr:hypothetical protein [Actinomycetota bacterium]